MLFENWCCKKTIYYNTPDFQNRESGVKLLLINYYLSTKLYSLCKIQSYIQKLPSRGEQLKVFCSTNWDLLNSFELRNFFFKFLNKLTYKISVNKTVVHIKSHIDNVLPVLLGIFAPHQNGGGIIFKLRVSIVTLI